MVLGPHNSGTRGIAQAVGTAVKILTECLAPNSTRIVRKQKNIFWRVNFSICPVNT